MQKQVYLIIFVFLVLFPNLIYSQTEEKIILNTVQQFFNALESRDTTLAKNVLILDGQFFSVLEKDSTINIKNTTHLDFINKLTHSNEPIREIMYEPIVLIHEHIAVVWTKYKFFKNKQFSHSGVDAFSLLKTSEGWKIAGIIYNIE